MRYLMIAATLAVSGCHRTELETAKAELAGCQERARKAEGELEIARKVLDEHAAAADARQKAEADAPRRELGRIVEHDAAFVSRWIGWPVEKVLDERGHVRDLRAVARALKERTCRAYPHNCLNVLVQPQNYGAVAGTAIYYDRIK